MTWLTLHLMSSMYCLAMGSNEFLICLPCCSRDAISSSRAPRVQYLVHSYHDVNIHKMKRLEEEIELCVDP